MVRRNKTSSKSRLYTQMPPFCGLLFVVKLGERSRGSTGIHMQAFCWLVAGLGSFARRFLFAQENGRPVLDAHQKVKNINTRSTAFALSCFTFWEGGSRKYHNRLCPVHKVEKLNLYI